MTQRVSTTPLGVGRFALPSKLNPRSSRAPAGTALIAILLALAGLLVATIGMATSTRPTVGIAYGSVAVFLMGLAASIVMAGSRGWLRSLAAGQLGPYVGLSTAVLFGLASLIWATGPPSDQAALIEPEAILAALVVVGVALACFSVGYLGHSLPSSRAISSGLRRTLGINREIDPGQRTAWLVFGLAVAADVVLVLAGTFGYLANPGAAVASSSPLAQPLALVSGLSVPAVGLSAYDRARWRRRAALLSLVVLLGLQTIIGAFSANKQTVALGFVAAILGYAAGAKRFPIMATAAAVLTFVFIVVPFNTAYRAVINASGTRLSPGQVLDLIGSQGLGTLLAPTPGSGLGSPVYATIARIAEIGNVGIVVEKTPSVIPDRPLSELLEAPLLGLVPRAIWPSKPILDVGYVFSQEYYDLPPSVYTSTPVTIEGDLWRHGGWPVLVLGMLLLGFGVAIIDGATSGIADAPLCLFLVLSFFPVFIKQETDVVSLLASIPETLVVVAVITRVFGRRRGAGWRSASELAQP